MGGDGVPLEAVRTQLRAALDMVVHVGRGSDGERRIESIADVVDGRVVERWHGRAA